MNTHQQEQVPDVTAESFDRQVTHASLPVLVNFQTPWSRRVEPLLGQLAETFAGRLRVFQANIAADPQLAARFKIRAVPTMLIFNQGVPVEFIVGTVPPRFVFATVCKALNDTPPPSGSQAWRARGRPLQWQLACESVSV